MADLTPKEKALLEKLLDMSGGYVLRFSDRTFAEFFATYDASALVRPLSSRRSTSPASPYAFHRSSVRLTIEGERPRALAILCPLHPSTERSTTSGPPTAAEFKDVRLKVLKRAKRAKP